MSKETAVEPVCGNCCHFAPLLRGQRGICSFAWCDLPWNSATPLTTERGTCEAFKPPELPTASGGCLLLRKIDNSTPQDERAKYKLVDKATMEDIECDEILAADEESGECEVMVQVLDERGHPKLDSCGNYVRETRRLVFPPRSIGIVTK